MAPPSKTWRAVERRVAKDFGAKRQRLSGSSGREDESSSDTTHPSLFIEVKYRTEHAIFNLFHKVKKLAAKESKKPVLILVEKGKPGYLICLQVDDIDHVSESIRRDQDRELRGETEENKAIPEENCQQIHA